MASTISDVPRVKMNFESMTCHVFNGPQIASLVYLMYFFKYVKIYLRPLKYQKKVHWLRNSANDNDHDNLGFLKDANKQKVKRGEKYINKFRKMSLTSWFYDKYTVLYSIIRNKSNKKEICSFDTLSQFYLSLDKIFGLK